ncbi:Uncharacterised protein [Nocardia otitidiscaviarum]|uniref:Uncharacterized protein n=1 Tax=Nocardia otitidiscaviarum TaxID=1823 RepID=A0A378YN83_9NOCA|nr:Uncharacterised protein [Nocardia otitidiscaviarum]
MSEEVFGAMTVFFTDTGRTADPAAAGALFAAL